MDDRARLIDYLRTQGASDEQIERAEEAGALGTLALELALRSSDGAVSFEDAAEQVGLSGDEAAALWRALGFPDPRHSPTSLAPSQVETLRVLAEVSRSLLGADATLRIARVLGSSVAQLAEAIVDTFRVNVEMPRHAQGVPYAEIVEDYSRVASVMVPAMTEAIGDILISHLVAVSRAQWGLDEQRATVTRELTVGFADLVDYTRSARALAPAELAAAVDRFEARVADVVSRHGGRVVKLIGDEAMFVAEDPARAARMAGELLEQLRPDEELAQVRIGLAAGPVVSHQGDYYGDTVNLAARLVKAAEPGSALVSESIAERCAAPLRAEPLEVGMLKGYDGPARAFRLA
jgi:adenylate cyclase